MKNTLQFHLAFARDLKVLWVVFVAISFLLRVRVKETVNPFLDLFFNWRLCHIFRFRAIVVCMGWLARDRGK